MEGGGALVAVAALCGGGGGAEKGIDPNPPDDNPRVVDEASMHGGCDPHPSEPVVVVAVPPWGTTVRP